MHGLPLDGSTRPDYSATEIYETKISQIGLEIAVSSYSIFNWCNMDQRLHGKSNPSMLCWGLLWWETAISLWLDWCVWYITVSVCVCISQKFHISYQKRKSNLKWSYFRTIRIFGSLLLQQKMHVQKKAYSHYCNVKIVIMSIVRYFKSSRYHIICCTEFKWPT